MTEITLGGEGRPVFVSEGLGFSCEHFTAVLSRRMRAQLNTKYLGGHNTLVMMLFSSTKFTIRKEGAMGN